MQSVIQIKDKDLVVKEFAGKRVVTLRDIDDVHQRPQNTSRRNFNKNRKHFMQGVDFFVRNSYEAKTEFGITAPSGLTLITESGYLMLVKSFTDDLAWEVQRMLVNNYFRSQDKNEECLPDSQEFFGTISNVDIKAVVRKMTIEAELTRLKSLHYDFSKYANRAETMKRKYRKIYEEFRIIEEKYRRNLDDLEDRIETLNRQLEGTVIGTEG